MKKNNTPNNQTRLKKEISSLGFLSLAFGSMIGVGWVTALGALFEQAGPVGTIIAFIIGGSLMLVIGLCYAEVTPMLPVAGGEVAYTYKAFGTSKAFIVGWFLAFGYLSVAAFEAISIGTVISFMLPEIDKWPLYTIGESTVYGSHLFLAFAFTVLITGINYFGVSHATKLQTALVMVLVIFTMIFVVSGIGNGSISNLSPPFVQNTIAGSIKGIIAVFVTVPFWYVGFDTIPQAAEESKEDLPLRNLGLFIIISIIGSTIFYIAVFLSAGMASPWQSLIKANLPTANAFRAAFDSHILVNLVLGAALIGLITSWNGFFLAGSRVLFSLGRGQIIGSSFGKTHPRFRTPGRAIIFSGLITFGAACLGRGAMIAFLDVSSFCIALTFLGVSLSLLKLRKQFPDLERPYKMPGGQVLPRIAILGSFFILAVMLFPGSPGMLAWPLEWLILGFYSVLAVIFWVRSKKYRNKVPDSERAKLILEDYN